MVAVGIFEHGELAPWLLLRLGNENDAARFKLPIRRRHVFASKRTIKERPDPIFMPFRGKEHDSRRGVGDSKLNPTLFVVEDLVR